MKMMKKIYKPRLTIE